MAEKYDKNPAQLMIRWVIEQNIVVIPKSTNENRIQENANVFDFTISDEDMEEIKSWDEHLVTGWNPYSYD